MNFKDPIIYANIIESSERELLPCPFCGGKPHITICGALNDLMFVQCHHCNAAPYGATPIYEHEENWPACFRGLVKQWNRREEATHE